MIFPISDQNPRRTFPLVTILIILLNAVFFYFELARGDQFVLQWSFIPQRFLANPLAGVPTLFTSMFMHAGWLHILGNLLYLWIFGDNVEDKFGHVRFLLFYLVCGLAASFAQMAFEWHSDIPTLGASGAIAGVLGAYLLLFPLARVKVLLGFFILPVPALIVIGFWILLQVLSGFGSLGATGGGVAYMAHVGGFTAGLMLALAWRIGRRGKPSY